MPARHDVGRLVSAFTMRSLLTLLLGLAACQPQAPPPASAVEVDTEAPLPPEPPPDPAPPPAPEPVVTPPTPMPAVDPPFAPGSPDVDRDPFRSDSVDDNREGEHILDRALSPPKADPPRKPEKKKESP